VIKKRYEKNTIDKYWNRLYTLDIKVTLQDLIKGEKTNA
jgi:hypothetical protein